MAEPLIDRTSYFKKVILAILQVAAKLERRQITERAERGNRCEGEGRDVWPRAEAHPAPDEGGDYAQG